MNEVKDHRVLKEDGHYYWIMRVNAADAKARCIEQGGLIRAFNDRGSVILADINPAGADLAQSLGPAAHFIPTDVTSEADCMNFLRETPGEENISVWCRWLAS